MFKGAIDVAAYLKFASIAGSDKTMDPSVGKEAWGDVIKPLDVGDIEKIKCLRALRDVEYEGSVFFHTFGLDDSPIFHL